MSFGISAAGKPTAVIKAVQASPGHGDPSQIEAVKAFIVGELESWPEGKAVIVEASGHHDAYSRNVTINLRPITLAEE